jgi:hypothetical protein
MSILSKINHCSLQTYKYIYIYTYFDSEDNLFFIWFNNDEINSNINKVDNVYVHVI